MKAILFDLDNTLYEYAPCHKAALDAAHRELSKTSDVSFDDFRSTHDRVRREIADELRGQAASRNRILFFKRIVESFLDSAAVSVAIDLFDAYWKEFFATMRPADQAHQVLAKLSGDYPLALVTNHTTDIQLRKIRELEFEKYFVAIVTSEEAGSEKPDRRIFDRALKHLNVAPGDAVMIGDDPQRDIHGAAQLGISTIHTRQFTTLDDFPSPPDRVVESLSEIVAVVGTM